MQGRGMWEIEKRSKRGKGQSSEEEKVKDDKMER